jgi:hypothetical protein
MNFPHLPTELTSKCHALIELHLKEHGSNLAADVGQRETMVFIGTHSDLFEILGSAVSCFKLQRVCWFVAACIIASSYFSVYLLIGLVPIVLVERFFARRERAMYLLLASIVLALEMVATNFAGLGDRYPEARDEAMSAFSGLLPVVRTALLERYLPNRNTASADVLRAFAAPNSN